VRGRAERGRPAAHRDAWRRWARIAERIELDGIGFAYEDSGGDGPAVLFLHGLGGSANGWLAQLQACRERGWRGIALDQRGAGRTDAPPGPYSVKLWARDAERLLSELGIDRAALVGHSVGCMIAAATAQRLADRCWALAVSGGTVSWPDGAVAGFAERARLARAGRLDEIAEAVAGTGLSQRCRDRDPRLLGLLREAIASNRPEAYALWAEATAAARIEAPESIAAPVLAFCGSEDPVTPPAASQRIAAAAGGESAVVEGAAHWCQIEAPQGTSEVLFAFLSRHLPGP
jgi:3-oxoadipate enol-lactonase